jgi:hypothetical protein
MINKKKVAAITGVEMYFQQEAEIKTSNKITWTDNRVGWSAQPRNNWTKQK